MSKFRIGDKVKCTFAYEYGTLVVGNTYEIEEFDGIYYKVKGVKGWWKSGRFKLAEKEETESESFNLKTNPWFIRVNNEEEFEAAICWAEEKGLEWDKIPREYDHSIKAIGTCLAFPSLQVFYYLLDNFDQRDRREIKLNFKTVIDHVEYPVLESEQQKKIRELKETIEKASAQIAEIEKEMK